MPIPTHLFIKYFSKRYFLFLEFGIIFPSFLFSIQIFPENEKENEKKIKKLIFKYLLQLVYKRTKLASKLK
jgi:hypothetical protein